MRQIVYFSTAAAPQTAPTIQDILEVSRSRNVRDGVTGLLVAGGNRFLQVIEGGDVAVEVTMARINDDVRHTEVHVLVNRNIAHRAFGDWSMAFRQEPKLGEYATFHTLVDALHDEVDEGLRSQVQCFARTFAITPISALPSPWPLAVR